MSSTVHSTIDEVIVKEVILFNYFNTIEEFLEKKDIQKAVATNQLFSLLVDNQVSIVGNIVSALDVCGFSRIPLFIHFGREFIKNNSDFNYVYGLCKDCISESMTSYALTEIEGLRSGTGAIRLVCQKMLLLDLGSISTVKQSLASVCCELGFNYDEYYCIFRSAVKYLLLKRKVEASSVDKMIYLAVKEIGKNGL